MVSVSDELKEGVVSSSILVAYWLFCGLSINCNALDKSVHPQTKDLFQVHCLNGLQSAFDRRNACLSIGEFMSYCELVHKAEEIENRKPPVRCIYELWSSLDRIVRHKPDRYLCGARAHDRHARSLFSLFRLLDQGAKWQADQKRSYQTARIEFDTSE